MRAESPMRSETDRGVRIASFAFSITESPPHPTVNAVIPTVTRTHLACHGLPSIEVTARAMEPEYDRPSIPSILRMPATQAAVNAVDMAVPEAHLAATTGPDRKSTRLNS